ncbi:hypothetical protein [Halomonas dongshanensis]|uniref:Tetratricopeptide repeat protein n=1 Tax=Halomonas dongshanensis TaxID=2890835 RepID=A0ABT2EAA4_9GAMM|nr:hypothetical protein [Halomonas dongshanensis]MCS2608496.1 hypothetical protein [Halomonas dongshanensis]
MSQTMHVMPVEESIDSQWARFTQAGNEAFERGDMREAQHYYEKAMAEANDMFDKAHTDPAACQYAPMTYTIAAFNLAGLFSDIGDRQMMHRYARAGLERLVELADERSVPHALRVQCVRHLGRAVITLEEIYPAARTHPDYRVLVANADLLQRQFDTQAGLYSVPSASARVAMVH